MKRLEDWSRDELLKITDEQRLELADLECAYEGIPLLPPRPEKPEIKYPEKDVTIYTVGDFNFTDEAEAQSYINFVNGMMSLVSLDYDYNVGSYDSKYVKERTAKTTIEKKSAYSEETYRELKSEIVRAKSAEGAYNEQASAYKKARDERNSIYKNIDDAISNAWELKRREDTLIRAFDKYSSLTNNGTIAMKLLKDAYDITDEEEAAVRSITSA